MANDPIGTILKNEGGFVNHPADKGQATNFGITQAVLSDWLGRKASITDVKNLTEETAREIYEKNYLVGPGIDQLPDPPMEFVLDMSVNHGPKRAVKILQTVINQAEFGPVTVDGDLGPKTLAAAEAAAEAMGPYFQNALVDERINFFNAIVEKNPSQGAFLKGWLRRAESFRLPVEE